MVESGATVQQVNDVLEEHGYTLPLNVALESVRSGGLIATGSTGANCRTRGSIRRKSFRHFPGVDDHIRRESGPQIARFNAIKERLDLDPDHLFFNDAMREMFG